MPLVKAEQLVYDVEISLGNGHTVTRSNEHTHIVFFSSEKNMYIHCDHTKNSNEPIVVQVGRVTADGVESTFIVTVDNGKRYSDVLFSNDDISYMIKMQSPVSTREINFGGHTFLMPITDIAASDLQTLMGTFGSPELANPYGVDVHLNYDITHHIIATFKLGCEIEAVVSVDRRTNYAAFDYEGPSISLPLPHIQEWAIGITRRLIIRC